MIPIPLPQKGRPYAGFSEMLLPVVLFFVFLLALCPTTYVGDSSLFAASSFSLGSAHPPGYPLFIMLGKLLTFLPFGNIAFKVNLVSALFGSLTSLVVFRSSMEITGNRHASWAAAFICGIAPIFFMESIKAEVYSLNSFLAMIVFYFGIRILKGDDIFKNALAGFFIIGLGFGNHHTIGFMGPVLLFPLALRWKEIKIPWLMWACLAFLCGFSVNLFLYIRSVSMEHSGGLILYSHAGTWDQFLRVLLREDYKGASTPAAISGTFSSGAGWINAFKNSLFYVAFRSLKPILPFFFLGFVALWRKKSLLFYFIFAFIIWFGLLGRMVCSQPTLKTEDIQIISVYFLPAIGILYCFTAAGFASFIHFFQRESFKILPKFIGYAVLSIPVILLPYSLKSYDLQNNRLAYAYGRDMLSVLPIKSMIFTADDNPSFIAFYMKSVERFREDVLVLDTGGKKDIYSLTTSPTWKYAQLYPNFYNSQKGTLKQINRDFAYREKLFANNPIGLTNLVSQRYSFYPYLFSIILYPRELDVQKTGILKTNTRNRLKSNYEKIQYEYAMQIPFTEDFLVRELQTMYAFNTMMYADFTKREGDASKGDMLYKKAFIMGYPERFLWPYINFLLGEGREGEASYLLHELKTGGWRDFATMLEQKAISVKQEMLKSGHDD